MDENSSNDDLNTDKQKMTSGGNSGIIEALKRKIREGET